MIVHENGGSVRGFVRPNVLDAEPIKGVEIPKPVIPMNRAARKAYHSELRRGASMQKAQKAARKTLKWG
jgi:hypothetical protein